MTIRLSYSLASCAIFEKWFVEHRNMIFSEIVWYFLKFLPGLFGKHQMPGSLKRNKLRLIGHFLSGHHLQCFQKNLAIIHPILLFNLPDNFWVNFSAFLATLSKALYKNCPFEIEPFEIQAKYRDNFKMVGWKAR